jgi:hypothetical protein
MAGAFRFARDLLNPQGQFKSLFGSFSAEKEPLASFALSRISTKWLAMLHRALALYSVLQENAAGRTW